MKRNIYFSAWILFFSTGASCAVGGSVDSSPVAGASVLKMCVSKAENLLGKTFLNDADRAYVYVFEQGYDVSFTQGAVGTFGERSKSYRQVLACGVSGGDIVFLGAPLKNAIVDEIDGHPYENYQEEVIELYFKRAGGLFEYCCSQLFDEKNIIKNNPDFVWSKGKVG